METHRYLEMLTPFFYPKLKSIDIHTCIVFNNGLMNILRVKSTVSGSWGQVD